MYDIDKIKIYTIFSFYYCFLNKLELQYDKKLFH